MATSDGLTKTAIDLSTHPVRYAVVYPDRAEVTREVAVSLEAGEHEIQLKNISKALDKESVRVDGVGSASITEVSFQEIAITKKEEDQTELNEKVSKLKEELSSVETKLSSLLKKKERIENQQNLLESYSNNLISTSQKTGTKELVAEGALDGLFSFMDTYETEALDIMKQLYSSEKEQKELEQRKNEITKSLNELTPKIKKGNDESDLVKQTVIGILLTVKEKGEIKLLVSYVVSNASWSPKYDLRVNSKQRTMNVSYFGMIQQNTGEDWINAKVSLSTASPSVGGSAPTLGTLCLNLLQFSDIKEKDDYCRNENAKFHLDYDRIRPGLASAGFGGSDRESITLPTAQVNEGLTSSIFDISAPATILSDNSAHKVSIVMIELKPTFEYETVPKLSQHAFLKAKVKNESRYHLLSGPANVFLDQSFVTKTCLSNVSPQEEFSCSLGVDSSVKVTYKPIQRFREESGVLNVSVIFNYKQVTEISNMRQEATTVHFTDHIPLSKDDKLKVVLLEPAIAKVKPGQPAPNPNLTAQNHITWTIDLAAGETKNVVMRYYVEYPKKKEVVGL